MISAIASKGQRTAVNNIESFENVASRVKSQAGNNLAA